MNDGDSNKQATTRTTNGEVVVVLVCFEVVVSSLFCVLLGLTEASLSLGKVSTSFVEFAFDPPNGTLSSSRLALDLLQEGFGLFDLATHLFHGLFGSDLGFVGLVSGSLGGRASVGSGSGGLFGLLDGGFLCDLGSAERKRVGSQVLGEFCLGLVTGHQSNRLILALGREFCRPVVEGVLLCLEFGESSLWMQSIR